MTSTNGWMSGLAKLLDDHRGRWVSTAVQAVPAFDARSAWSQLYCGEPTAQPTPLPILVHSELITAACHFGAPTGTSKL
jgi:hypothetical protein